MRAIVDSPDLWVEFTIERGQIQYLNSREFPTAALTSGTLEPHRKRHLLRVWTRGKSPHLPSVNHPRQGLHMTQGSSIGRSFAASTAEGDRSHALRGRLPAAPRRHARLVLSPLTRESRDRRERGRTSAGSSRRLRRRRPRARHGRSHRAQQVAPRARSRAVRGASVAAVVAETPALAEDAAALVEVE